MTVSLLLGGGLEAISTVLTIIEGELVSRRGGGDSETGDVLYCSYNVS